MATCSPAPRSGLPRWTRWAALVWFLVWFPAYARTWGWPNFLHLCDVTVILACAGFWLADPLLLSSQAIAAPLADAVWCLDAGWRLATGHTLFGGTEYLWDATKPQWVRLLSLFHVVLPLLMLWAVWRVGYDRRGLALEGGLTAALLAVSRFVAPERNLNYAFRDPLLHRQIGPVPVHLIVILTVMVAVFYLPAHAFFVRYAPQSKRGS